MDTTQFCSKFIVTLQDKIPVEYLQIVYQNLFMYSSNYDVSEKCTDVSTYVEGLPDCYKMFFVSKKLEGMSINSIKHYDRVLKDFMYYMNKPVTSISTDDVRLYLYKFQLNHNASDCYMDNIRCVISSFMAWLCDNSYIEKNICRPIKRVKYEDKPREPLTYKELEIFRHSYKSDREEAICETLYSTGCRVSELCSMNIQDLDFDSREITVLGKGKKYRTVYLSERAVFAIRRYLQTRRFQSDALFVGVRKNVRLSKECCEYLVKKVGIRSGLSRRVFPHLLRHTFATHALNRGMNVAEVSKLLGHADLETTMIYAKCSKDNVKFSHTKYIQ